MATKKKTQKSAKRTTKKGTGKKTTGSKSGARSPGKSRSSKSSKKVSKKSANKKSVKKVKGTRTRVVQPRARRESSVKIGDLLPAFSLSATSGQVLTADSLRGKKVVLYFYPKDNTPGCTLEGYDFRRLYSDFQKLGVEIYGISRDSVESHEKFKSKCGFPFSLLSDDHDVLSGPLGVIQMKNMYGKKFEGIERSTFVFDENGRLLKEWRKVKVEGHADAVLTYIQSL